MTWLCDLLGALRVLLSEEDLLLLVDVGKLCVVTRTWLTSRLSRFVAAVNLDDPKRERRLRRASWTDSAPEELSQPS